jgi:hypothetical protein
MILFLVRYRSAEKQDARKIMELNRGRQSDGGAENPSFPLIVCRDCSFDLRKSGQFRNDFEEHGCASGGPRNEDDL